MQVVLAVSEPLCFVALKKCEGIVYVNMIHASFLLLFFQATIHLKFK